MDRSRAMTNANLIYAIKRFAGRRRAASEGLVPCYAVTKAHYSTLRAVQLKDGTFKICSTYSRKH